MAQVLQATPLVHCQTPMHTPARALRRTRFSGGDDSENSGVETRSAKQRKAASEKTPAMRPVLPTPSRRPVLTPRCVYYDVNAELKPALDNIRKRIDAVEDEEDENVKKVSPSLAKLRMTPGRAMQKQRILERKHHEAKSKVENLNIGGGVCLWPEMQNMRLTKSEVYLLTGICLGLIMSVYGLFKVLHGELQEKLQVYTVRLHRFWDNHYLETHNQVAFNQSVLKWHSHFSNLMDDIHIDFDTNLSKVKTPKTYMYYCSVVLYIGGIGTLLFYLADNMFSKSKLTPRRIKTWVSLLVVMACWSILMVSLLSQAQGLEFAIENNVHKLSNALGDLVYLQLDLSHFTNVLTYWRTRSLPPTTLGTLSILGMLQVRDVMYYLQYYSLPVITAICTPVVKLILALREIYSVK